MSKDDTKCKQLGEGGFTFPKTLDPVAQACEILIDMMPPMPRAVFIDGVVVIQIPDDEGQVTEIWLTMEQAAALGVELTGAIIQAMDAAEDK